MIKIAKSQSDVFDDKRNPMLDFWVKDRHYFDKRNPMLDFWVKEIQCSTLFGLSK